MQEVDDYLAAQPEPLARIMSRIRSMVLSQGPEIEEKFSFKIPFYYYSGWMVYLTTYKGGVDMSFIRGFELSDAHGRLEVRNRKQIKSIHIRPEEPFPEDVIRETLMEAMILNELAAEAKKKKKKADSPQRRRKR
ncbi:MAG: DUF1801 domain-containing protein [Bacteroidetes bacterium]|nr:DUF1801 domain-containing protein [Bacteroidota bacterium]